MSGWRQRAPPGWLFDRDEILSIQLYGDYLGVEPKIAGKPPKMDDENNGKPY